MRLKIGWGTGIRTQTDGFRGQRVLETLVLTTTLFPKKTYCRTNQILVVLLDNYIIPIYFIKLNHLNMIHNQMKK